MIKEKGKVGNRKGRKKGRLEKVEFIKEEGKKRS